jgi:hypothetical protein
MTSHRIHLYYATDGITDDTDTADEVSNSIPGAPTEPLDPTKESYYTAQLTYAASENPLTVLEDPYYALVDYCSWSRVGYHACDHGYDGDDSCQWREENIREDPPVPEHVPTFL